MDNSLESLIRLTLMEEREKRKRMQMTLGRLIRALEISGLDEIDRVKKPRSYRGYYSDLALEPVEGERMPVYELISNLEEAVDKTYEGYKGGEFFMGSETPMWLSAYGESSGLRIVGISNNGNFITEIEQW